MRDFATIIDTIITFIPDDFDPQLVKELRDLRAVSMYHSPEMRSKDWAALSAILNNRLGRKPDNIWKAAIFSIVTTTPFQNVKIEVEAIIAQ